MAKKTVIQPMQKGDFVLEKGTLKIDYKRGVVINDKTQNLTVTPSLNHKKGTFSINFKWNMEAITGDDLIDMATLKAMN